MPSNETKSSVVDAAAALTSALRTSAMTATARTPRRTEGGSGGRTAPSVVMADIG